MAKVSNEEFINRILVAIQEGRIDWQETAKPREFSASFGGRWTLIISQRWSSERQDLITDLEVKNSEGDSLISFSSTEDKRVEEIHELARRHVLKIDESLTELLTEIEKPKNDPS